LTSEREKRLGRASQLFLCLDSPEAVSQGVAELRIFLAHESCLSQAALRSVADVRVLHAVSGPIDLIAIFAAASSGRSLPGVGLGRSGRPAQVGSATCRRGGQTACPCRWRTPTGTGR
jgi:hypothetical protein